MDGKMTPTMDGKLRCLQSLLHQLGANTACEAVSEARDAIDNLAQPSQQKCFCDRMYPDSDPDASCGDCPTRDYKSTQPAQAVDVGAIREVIADLKSFPASDRSVRLSNALTRAIGNAQAEGWMDIATAPKGGGAEYVTDPNWVEPPSILLRFGEEGLSVAYWDWYYAEGGNGCTDGFAWIEPCSGDQLNLHFSTPPDGWMPIPTPPTKATPNAHE